MDTNIHNGKGDRHIYEIVGAEVAAFADGHQVIKRSMKEDEMISESLVKMEQDLKSHGDYKGAHRLARTLVYLWVHPV